MVKNVKEALAELSGTYPAKFAEKRNNIFILDFVVAQRKAFLRTQKLTYHCKLKVDEENKAINFFEILKESGAGLSSGGYDEFGGSGFGFKAEKTKTGLKSREGTIKEQSDLFGKKYNYEFNFEKVREDVEGLARKFGYSFNLVLIERNIK
jgi:hypothetical protein